MNRRNNRKALRMLGLAAMCDLGMYFNTPEDKGGGGGDNKNPDDKKPKGDKGEKDPEKVQLTMEELARKLDDAKASAKAEFDEQRKKEKEEAERMDLEKKGETQKLLDKEREERKATDAKLAEMELKVRRSEVKDQLRRYLDEKHKEYVGSLDDIFLHVAVDADTKDDEIAKRIKAAAEGFVSRNPRARVSPPPPPANGRSVDRKSLTDADKPMTFTGAAARF